jgi:hypothetical protein
VSRRGILSRSHGKTQAPSKQGRRRTVQISFTAHHEGFTTKLLGKFHKFLASAAQVEGNQIAELEDIHQHADLIRQPGLLSNQPLLPLRLSL